MKKTISIFMLAALLIGGLTGCYEDKGNYKYRDINEVTYKILPESEDGYYRFKQPPVDTMYVDYTVDLSHQRRKPGVLVAGQLQQRQKNSDRYHHDQGFKADIPT